MCFKKIYVKFSFCPLPIRPFHSLPLFKSSGYSIFQVRNEDFAHGASSALLTSLSFSAFPPFTL